MNRRLFLERAAIAVAAMSIDPAELIAIPKGRVWSIPAETYLEQKAVVVTWLDGSAVAIHRKGFCLKGDRFDSWAHDITRAEAGFRWATPNEIRLLTGNTYISDCQRRDFRQ